MALLRLIKESELRRNKIIGSGAFGKVYKVCWFDPVIDPLNMIMIVPAYILAPFNGKQSFETVNSKIRHAFLKELLWSLMIFNSVFRENAIFVVRKL